MKFAKIVFYAAGVWGIAVLTPLYFSTAVLDRVPSPPVADPQFFYGFLSVTMTFQLVFLVIGSNPARFRPLMFPSVIEKFGFIVSMAVLHAQGRVTRTEFITTLPDLLLGILFTIVLIKTRASALPHGHDR